jgi:hypothetical protein
MLSNDDEQGQVGEQGFDPSSLTEFFEFDEIFRQIEAH